MEYKREEQFSNGKICLFRSAEPEDAKDYLDYFTLTHSETDYLLSYNEENSNSIEKYALRLQETKESKTDVEICAFVDGKLVASAGNNMLHDRIKTKHRAEFGISVIRDYWGMGIGGRLVRQCIDCAKEAGFLQLELEVVAENQSAVALYEKYGFVEYGRNPRGFRTKDGAWQELVLMRLEL